jgi:hypothetical protein
MHAETTVLLPLSNTPLHCVVARLRPRGMSAYYCLYHCPTATFNGAMQPN